MEEGWLDGQNMTVHTNAKPFVILYSLTKPAKFQVLAFQASGVPVKDEAGSSVPDHLPNMTFLLVWCGGPQL